MGIRKWCIEFYLQLCSAIFRKKPANNVPVFLLAILHITYYILHIAYLFDSAIQP